MNILKKAAAILTAVAAIGAYIPVTPYLHEQSAYAYEVQTVEADIDFSQYDLTDFETVCKLTVDYGDCIRSGDQILIINLVEDYGFQETYVDDIAVVLAPDEGEYSLSKLNGVSYQEIHTSRGHLMDIERIRESDIICIADNRECFYNCCLITADAQTEGELNVTYQKNETSSTYSFKFEKAESRYKISDVVDVEDYDQLSYILNSQWHMGACFCYGNECILVSPSYIEPEPMVEAGPDYDYNSYYESLYSQGINVTGFKIDGDAEYNVLKSGKCYDKNNKDNYIVYSIVEFTSAGEAIPYIYGDNTERTLIMDNLKVNENGKVFGSNNLEFPGNLVLEPKNIYQKNAMIEAYPEGFKYEKYFDRKNIYFLNNIDPIGRVDKIIVSSESRYSLVNKGDASVFTPWDEGVYVVTIVTSTEAIVQVGNTHCHYFYPVYRNYYVKKSSSPYLTVNYIGETRYRDKDIAEKLASHKDDLGCFSYSESINEMENADYLKLVYNCLDPNRIMVDWTYICNQHIINRDMVVSNICAVMPENAKIKDGDYLKVSGVGDIASITKVEAPEYLLDGDSDSLDASKIEKYKQFCFISLTEDDGFVEVASNSFKESYYERVFKVTDGNVELFASGLSDCIDSGDVNFDSEKNIADLVLINKQMLRRTRFCNTQLRFADMNMDGIVDGFDMVLMRRMLIKQAVPKSMD
ncbi:MAG: dockerin type I repeat-containing protein [Ruminococcus sp.]|nr:dockerin type I repeat-containing protein [Ruminococcus sp.]